jgi:FHA domain
MDAALYSPLGRIALGASNVTIGRVTGNQLVVNDPKASSHHAEVRPLGQGYGIVDLGSTNGTYLNEQRLTPNIPYPLSPGDRIRIGDTSFTYEASDVSPIAPTVYSAPNQEAYQPTVAATPYDIPGYAPNAVPPPPYTAYGQDAQQGYQPPAQGFQSAQPYPPPYAPPPYAPPATPGFAGNVAPPKGRSRRTLWIILGIVGGVLLLTCIACGVLVYAVRSTPTKTLTDYCNDLKNKDFQSAYGELSSTVQSQVTEAQYTSVENTSITPLRGVSSCNVHDVNDNGSTGTGIVTYTFGNGQSGPVPYTLASENSTWKITREGK